MGLLSSLATRALGVRAACLFTLTAPLAVGVLEHPALFGRTLAAIPVAIVGRGVAGRPVMYQT